MVTMGACLEGCVDITPLRELTYFNMREQLGTAHAINEISTQADVRRKYMCLFLSALGLQRKKATTIA